MSRGSTASILTEDEAVGFEELPVRPRPHAVHGAGLQIHQHGTRHVLPLVAFIVIDVDALQLQLHQVLIGTSVLSRWLDAMLIADDFPELSRKK